MEVNLRNEKLGSWLSSTRNENKNLKYNHLKLTEVVNLRGDTFPVLQEIIDEAHEDYKRSKRSVLSKSLDPTQEINFDNLGEADPAYGYPSELNLTTLKGYFGEIFAGIIAENFSPFNIDTWKVPVFCFRHHQTAFDQLETFKRTGQRKKATIGRPGDDCLAFVLDDEKNQIVKTLFCEAKCTNGHDSKLINNAHSQISDLNPVPVELLRILEILEDYDTEHAKKWAKAISNLYVNDYQTERFDLVSYVCGKKPKTAETWIDNTKPHKTYTGKRQLEAVEVHISEVDNLVQNLYRKEMINVE
ncbi:TPA: hypothetical protein ACLBZ1_002321 [Bacillus cereus]